MVVHSMHSDAYRMRFVLLMLAAGLQVVVGPANTFAQSPTGQDSPSIARDWAIQLRSGSLRRHLEAAEALEQMGTAAIPALTELLGDKDHLVRVDASHILRKIGPASVPALVRLLRGRDRQPRFRALVTLARLGPEAKAAIPAIAEALQDENWGIQAAALYAMEEMGQEAKVVIPALVNVLKDPDPNLPVAAARILRKMGADAVPFLTAVVGDRQSKARYYAVVTLGRIGAEAESALPAIREVLQDSRWHVRMAAADAIREIEHAVTLFKPAR